MKIRELLLIAILSLMAIAAGGIQSFTWDSHLDVSEEINPDGSVDLVYRNQTKDYVWMITHFDSTFFDTIMIRQDPEYTRCRERKPISDELRNILYTRHCDMCEPLFFWGTHDVQFYDKPTPWNASIITLLAPEEQFVFNCSDTLTLHALKNILWIIPETEIKNPPLSKHLRRLRLIEYSDNGYIYWGDTLYLNVADSMDKDFRSSNPLQKSRDYYWMNRTRQPRLIIIGIMREPDDSGWQLRPLKANHLRSMEERDSDMIYWGDTLFMNDEYRHILHEWIDSLKHTGEYYTGSGIKLPPEFKRSH